MKLSAPSSEVLFQAQTAARWKAFSIEACPKGYDLSCPHLTTYSLSRNALTACALTSYAWATPPVVSDSLL